MSDELDNIQESKNFEEGKLQKKLSSKKKDLEIIEQFKYKSEEGEKLITDKSSEPLNKISDFKEKINNQSMGTVKKDLPKKNIIKQPKIELKSNKELYESYIKELKYFSLNLNGDIIYDSSIDKSNECPVKFDNDYFILYGKKYSYNGLKIQKINKR
jgi:hypothetical protein